MNGALTLSAAGLTFITAHEGCRASAYRDAAGIETIGYGHRLTDGESFPGGIDEAAARRLLAADAARAEEAVRAHVAVALTQGQFDALVSFVFNIGAGAFAGSTLLRKLNDGDVAGAADEFLRWNKIASGGALVAEPGLTARRAAERKLFLGG
ncbi:MAG: lysozyme [Stellaceae bacterium]